MDANQRPPEPRLLISRDALLHNASLIRKALPPGTKVCAVVKADAYGHGADIVVDALYNFSSDELEAPAVDALAVATIDEAEQLPGGTALPIFIFRPIENGLIGPQRARIEFAIRNNWTLTLCSPSAADDVARIALSLDKRAGIQVMLDTGMARSGVSLDRLDRLLHTITSHASLRLVAVGTHFSEAERSDSTFTAAQLDRFRAATDEIARTSKIIRHAANSAGVFLHPTSHFDMTRPGLALYGVDPTFAPSLDRPLRPVLKWTAPLLGIRDIKKGIPVGYGQSWCALRDTKIGLVPVGYADGYLRAFSNNAVMLVDGKPFPVVGTVSMDSTTIDLGRDSPAVIGDEVTILDDNPLSPASVYALARRAGTIPYEIFCRIGPRVRRVVREAEVADDKVIS
jgi:alanine racemase